MFKIISVGWNCAEQVWPTLRSVFSQSLTDYQVHIVDDGSTDSRQQELIKLWVDSQGDRWMYTFHNTQRGAVRNQYEGIRAMQPADEDIIVFLDLDGDRLANDDVLQRLADIYSDGHTLLTYGNYRSLDQSGGPDVGVRAFPKDVVLTNSYRKYTKTWGTCFNHLRTVKWKVLKHVPIEYFQWDDGTWLEAATDYATMMSCLELAGGRYTCVLDVFLLYNNNQPHPDNVRHPEVTAASCLHVLNMPPLEALRDV